jgi:hypothetical protein
MSRFTTPLGDSDGIKKFGHFFIQANGDGEFGENGEFSI